MASFTSSSNHRAPEGRWLATWLVALVLAISICALVEYQLKGQGHLPSIVDDPELWAIHRGLVYSDDRKTIVLVGNSRTQLSFSTNTFKKAYPNYNVVQLSTDGRMPYGFVKDLVEDENFTGIILFQLDFPFLLEKEYTSTFENEYIRAFKQKNINNQLNRFITSWFQSEFVIANPSFRFTSVIPTMLKGLRSRPLYLTTNLDRSREADYRLHPRKYFRQEREQRVWDRLRKMPGPTDDIWLEEPLLASSWANALEARGGKLVAIRYPVSGKYLQIVKMLYPKEKYWDRFAQQTTAETLNFMDHKSLTVFECPDSSHIDKRDSPRFTLALAKVLEEKNIIEAPDLN